MITDIHIPKRAIEAVRWIADGKTQSETAELMGIRPMQVYRLLVKAKDEMGCSTTASLVATAVRKRIIE